MRSAVLKSKYPGEGWRLSHFHEFSAVMLLNSRLSVAV